MENYITQDNVTQSDVTADNVTGENDEINELTTLKNGDYEGQGAKSPEYTKDKEGKDVASTIEYLWVWKNSSWIKTPLCITIPQLQKIFKSAKIEHLKNIEYEININSQLYGLINFNIICHLLAQVGHETGGFKKSATIENGKYSTLERIGVVFGTTSTIYSKVSANPKYYLNNEEHFLNLAYANKGGNEDENSGDGYKYRGRGYIQLTLKDNYIEFNDAFKNLFTINIDFVTNPELVGTDNKYAIISAMIYFKKHTISSINHSKTKGKTINNVEFKNITKTINVKCVGMLERKNIYVKACEIIGV